MEHQLWFLENWNITGEVFWHSIPGHIALPLPLAFRSQMGIVIHIRNAFLHLPRTLEQQEFITASGVPASFIFTLCCEWWNIEIYMKTMMHSKNIQKTTNSIGHIILNTHSIFGRRQYPEDCILKILKKP